MDNAKKKSTALLLATAITSINLGFCWSVSAQTVRYVHTDGLGSVSVLTDSSRNIIERREYEPYGANLVSAVDGVGYAGHVMDAETGLTYMQQRYYDPTVGLFISADPVSSYKSNDIRLFNRYAYGFNNPYKFSDKDGRCPVCVAPIVGGVVGAATNIAVQKIMNPDKPVNVTEVVISGVAGAVSGGAGALLVTAVARGAVSVGQAVVIQGAVNLGSGASSSVAQNLVEGKEVSGKEAATSAVGNAIGGLIGSGIGVAAGDFSEATSKATVQRLWTSSAPGAANIASTTSSTGLPIAGQTGAQAVTSQVGQAAAGSAASVAQKNYDEKHK